MKRLTICVGLVGLLMIGSINGIAAPKPDDFAYGLTLEVDGDGAIYELSIPRMVYEAVVQPDLGDIRIFNSHELMVPHVVRRPMADKTNHQPAIPVAFFPLYDDGDQDHSAQEIGSSVNITTNSQGAIIDVSRGKAINIDSVINAYLFDMSALEKKPNALYLKWARKETQVVMNVKVEHSEDLANWRGLVDRSTLAELSYEGRNLSKHTIELPQIKPKYLRISWPAGKQGVELLNAMAHFPNTQLPQPHNWVSVQGRRMDSKRTDYVFDVPASLPIEQIKVRLPQYNTLVWTRLYSRPSQKSAWQIRHQGLLYRLNINNTILENRIIKFPLVSDRHWRLHVEDSGSGLGTELPILEVGWVAHQLLFVARGAAPYKLAYGSHSITSSNMAVELLLQEMDLDKKGQYIKVAQIGSHITLGGEDRLKPKIVIPWKQWLLWAILVIGVMALGWMSVRLYTWIKGVKRST